MLRGYRQWLAGSSNSMKKPTTVAGLQKENLLFMQVTLPERTNHPALPIFRNQCGELRQHHSWRRLLRKVRYTVLKIQDRITLSNLHSSQGNQSKSSSAIVSRNRVTINKWSLRSISIRHSTAKKNGKREKKTKGASSSDHFGFVENFMWFRQKFRVRCICMS
jgi:hypothetical protein